MEADRTWAWDNIEQSLENILSYASYIDNRTGEREEVTKMAERFIRSARWHRRQNE